jgi:hypothetical protein
MGLLVELDHQARRVFQDTREGVETIDVDAYLRTRDLLSLFYRSLDAEVFRVCFDERLSSRSVPGGD